MKDRTLRGNIRTKPILNLKEIFEQEIKKGNKNNPQITFQEFLDGAEKITEAGVRVMKVVENVVNIKEQLEAEVIYDNLKIKKFGIGGSHITLPSEFIGKSARVIIKK